MLWHKTIVLTSCRLTLIIIDSIAIVLHTTAAAATQQVNSVSALAIIISLTILKRT